MASLAFRVAARHLFQKTAIDAPPLTRQTLQADIARFERWIDWLHRYVELTGDFRRLVDDVAQLAQKGDLERTKIPLKSLLLEVQKLDTENAPRFPWLSHDYEGPQLGRDGGAGTWIDNAKRLYNAVYPLWDGKQRVDTKAVQVLSKIVDSLEGTAKALKSRITADQRQLGKMKMLTRTVQA